MEENPEVAQELLSFCKDHAHLLGLLDACRSGAEKVPDDFAAPVLSGEDGESGLTSKTANLSTDGIDWLRLQCLLEGRDKIKPRIFGDYELLEEVARGGMGVVYRARQLSLDRIVAVKMILAGELATESAVQRFRLEAEAAGNLQHPHIIGIHEVGEHDGRHFFSMEFVEGESLASISHQGRVSPKQAARYVKQAAEAIACAHSHGVTHRDVKPSNILIDHDDQARITDFGLAKRIETDSNLTLSGQVVGTPAYMAPEQAMGSQDHDWKKCDIYSLGAVLYELLTGCPPFQGRTQVDTLVQAREHRPKTPRQIDPRLPRELEMICLKCMERNPEDRYSSAKRLAEDLERYLVGDSISISGPSILDRLVRTLERGHHDEEFQTWSRMLIHFAWIVLIGNCLVPAIHRFANTDIFLWLTLLRVAEFTAMGAIFWAYRRDWYPPQGKPARQLWSLWLGYVAGSIALALINHILGGNSELGTFYPQLAVLGSLGFIMMGSSYWGYCYLIGGSFLVMAIVMPFVPALAPVIFGLVWGASLLTLAGHLRKLSANLE